MRGRKRERWDGRRTTPSPPPADRYNPHFTPLPPPTLLIIHSHPQIPASHYLCYCKGKIEKASEAHIYAYICIKTREIEQVIFLFLKSYYLPRARKYMLKCNVSENSEYRNNDGDTFQRLYFLDFR